MMANLDAFFFTIWAWLVSVQREIYGDIATMLRAFAASGDWGLLVAFVPWGVAFGAAHALTPGHSKMVLAMFVAGSGAGFASGLRTAGILASTHILMSVLIVLLGLPLASMALGEVGRAVFLETLSRSLLGLVGLWLLISALRSGNGDGHGHRHGRGVAFAADEFIRRFLLHVLPRGFHRIRHYGLLAGSARKASLALARQLLDVAAPPDPPASDEPEDFRPPCPCCGGRMIIIETFERWKQPRGPPRTSETNRETGV